MASLWERLNEQSSALAAAQQAQHSAGSNAAEREAELLAQLDSMAPKLQVRFAPAFTIDVCTCLLCTSICYMTRLMAQHARGCGC